MRPKQLLLLLLALWINIPASAYGALVNGIYYNLSGNEATVTYKDTNFGSYSGGIVIPTSVNYNGTTYSVTSIGNYAFYGCSGLTSITIPNSVTSIGYFAFQDCSGLTSITIPNSVTSIGGQAFYNCSGLTSITIPNSVTSIGQYAFRNCSNLLSVTMPASVISFTGSQAFGPSNNIETVYITDLSKWLQTDFDSGNNPLRSGARLYLNNDEVKDLVIPAGTTSLLRAAFEGCESLTSVFIPASVTSIGGYAFAGCPNLTSVVVENPSPVTISSYDFSNRANATLYVPAGSKSAYEAADYWKEFKEIKEFIIFADANVKAICVANWDTNGDGELSEEEAAAVTDLGSAFSNNSTITSFNELQYFTGLKSIGNSAFDCCFGLTSITIPNSVTSIGVWAFSGCYGLTSITIPNSVTSIGNFAFDGCSGLTSITIPNSVTSIGKGAFSGCSGLTSITIPEGVTSIGQNAFQWCSGLTSITIPNSVTGIAINAFSNCSGLTSITIPNSVTSIGSGAFYNCSGLTSITIPNSVTSIGNGAFRECSGLTSITIPNSVTSIGDYAFSNCSNLTSVTMPASVINFTGGYAFGENNNIESVYITDMSKWLQTPFNQGNNPLRSGARLYLNNEEVKNLVIPEGTTSILTAAFEGCESLTSVFIPASVTSIGGYAFSGCTNLASVVVENPSPVTITSDVFSNRANATLIVPVGSKAAYEAADYWKEFKRIIEFIEGDVNGDGEMDVVDVVDIARYVVGTPAETFVRILADINNNGDVNLGDAVSLVNMIAGDQNFVKALRAPQRASEGNEALTLEGTDGMLSLALQNTREYTAFQFDLYVPEATDVTSMLLNAQRKQRHHLLYNKVEDGHWRVAAISTSNCTFNGYEGELLRVALEGIANDDISIRNIRFFDMQSNEYAFDDICLSGTTTNLEGLTPSSKAEESIYDLQGRKVTNRQLTRGIYIVNGKKVVRK